MLSDAELISRAIVESDREAYGRLVEKYQSPIRALFRKLTSGDMNLADDLSQDTFLRAFRGLHGFRGGSQFLTWLYAIAKNVYFEHIRSLQSQVVSTEQTTEGSEEMTADHRMDALKLLKQLDPDERLILSLSYAEGMSHSEVAELMKMPVGTIKTIISRCKEKLRASVGNGIRREV